MSLDQIQYESFIKCWIVFASVATYVAIVSRIRKHIFIVTMIKMKAETKFKSHVAVTNRKFVNTFSLFGFGFLQKNLVGIKYDFESKWTAIENGSINRNIRAYSNAKYAFQQLIIRYSSQLAKYQKKICAECWLLDEVWPITELLEYLCLLFAALNLFSSSIGEIGLNWLTVEANFPVSPASAGVSVPLENTNWLDFHISSNLFLQFFSQHIRNIQCRFPILSTLLFQFINWAISY